jgi:DNA repair exonuclease SbcCD ATPase subunit
MEATQEIEREVIRLNERLRHVYVSEDKINRVHADIQSLERKYNENELRIATNEPTALVTIEQRDTAIKIKSRIDTLTNTKLLLGPIKSSIDWLISEYPESSTMTLESLFDFIDDKKVELMQAHDRTREQIRKLSSVENKYKTLLKRRASLMEKIEQKTNEYNNLIEHANQLSKELDSIVTLQKIKALMKSIVKDELAVERINATLDEI